MHPFDGFGIRRDEPEGVRGEILRFYWVMCDFARRIGPAYEMPSSAGVPIER